MRFYYPFLNSQIITGKNLQKILINIFVIPNYENQPKFTCFYYALQYAYKY